MDAVCICEHMYDMYIRVYLSVPIQFAHLLLHIKYYIDVVVFDYTSLAVAVPLVPLCFILPYSTFSWSFSLFIYFVHLCMIMHVIHMYLRYETKYSTHVFVCVCVCVLLASKFDCYVCRVDVIICLDV